MDFRRARGLAVALVLGAVLAAPATARAEDPPAARNEEVIITMGEGMQVTTFLTTISKITGIPILWQENDKALASKRISGAPELKAPRSKIFDLVRALLTFHELVLVPIGPRGYEIYLVMDARQTTGILRLKPVYVEVTDQNVRELESQDGLFVAAVIPVQNMESLRDARQALQRMITANNVGSVTEVPDARAFLVTDFAPNVAAIWRTLRTMDERPSGRQSDTAFFDLQHARAENVARILEELFGAKRVAGAPPAPPGGETPASTPRFSADPDTNQVVVIAPSKAIEAMQVVVRHLDREPVKVAPKAEGDGGK